VVDELDSGCRLAESFIFRTIPLFYEPAAWGIKTRRDRLQALTLLASYRSLCVTTSATSLDYHNHAGADDPNPAQAEFLKASKVFVGPGNLA
jgi:hypothetical protein